MTEPVGVFVGVREIVAAAAVAAAGWWFSIKRQILRIDRIEKREREYVTRDEFNGTITRLDSTLVRVDDKLDRVLERMPAKSP